jgi:hypothetical protein
MPFRDWIADMQISLTELCDPVERGEHLGFTVAEDERFATEPMGRRPINRKNGVKVTAARFPSWITPAGETAEETKVRRDKFTLAVAGIPTAPLGSSLLLMICNTEGPPWGCPRKPPNLSHWQRKTSRRWGDMAEPRAWLKRHRDQ